MAVALQMSYTDDDTGATYPFALIQITRWHIEGSTSSATAEVDLAYYVDADALAASKTFKRKYGVPITNAEISPWIAAILLVSYQTMNARAEFAAAAIVTV
jgi:hypothetical protein